MFLEDFERFRRTETIVEKWRIKYNFLKSMENIFRKKSLIHSKLYTLCQKITEYSGDRNLLKKKNLYFDNCP